MPGLDGLAATAQLRTALPSCRVIVVTTFGRPGYLRRAMEAGASGFLLKDAPAAQLAEAIRRVAAGGRVVDPSLALDALTEGVNPLSPREREVLAASLEIGDNRRPCGSTLAVGGDRPQPPFGAIQKVGARNRAEAARIAQEKGCSPRMSTRKRLDRGSC
jgi:two-component system response regulator DesR